MDARIWATRAASYLKNSISRRGFSTASMKNLRFTDSHEWVKVDRNAATIGTTDEALHFFGEVLSIELPLIGSRLKQFKGFDELDTIRTTAPLISPVSGKVIDINEELESSPAVVNSSPYDEGWIAKVKMTDASEINNLMDREKYSWFCEEQKTNEKISLSSKPRQRVEDLTGIRSNFLGHSFA